MNDAFSRLDEYERDKLKQQAKKPKWLSPMLATLTDEPFSDDAWLYERKLDGIRCLAHCDGGKPALYSRNRQRLDKTYPELMDALAAQRTTHYIADGEIVAFRGSRTSFSRLQGRSGIHESAKARASGIAVYYYLFDLPWLDGHDLTRLPLRTRKRLLKGAFQFRGPLRYATHRNATGKDYHRAACRKGWEGVIAKKAASGYVSKRSRDWLKFKCVNQQELVIGGYTDPQGSRKGFGALLLGYYEGGRLRYAGRVGTGFDDAQLLELHKQLMATERKSSSFSDDDIPPRGVHWVNPRFVAEIGFTEWTDDGRLRHPRFLGLREDKPARKVLRERPK